MMHDATLFRVSLEMVSLLALANEIFARPGSVDRIMDLADIYPPVEPPCPTRGGLVAMLA